MPATTEPARRLARTRHVALIGLSTVLSLWALVMSSFGPAMALFGTLPDPSLRFTVTSAGAFKVLTVGAALAVLLSRGRSTLGVRVLAVGQVVWFVTDLLAPEDDATVLARLLRFVVATTVWVGPWLLLAPDRSRLWTEPVQVRRPVLALAAVASAPLLGWAVANARGGLSHALEGTAATEVRFDLTGMPLAVLAALALAALHDRRWWDTVLVACCTVVGALALVYPDADGAPGRAAGGLVLVGIVVGLAALPRRRGEGSAPATVGDPLT